MLLGVWEMVLVAVVALIVLGPEKMPEALRKLARALSQVRRVADDIKQNFDDMWVEPQPKLRARTAPTTHEAAQRHACEEPMPTPAADVPTEGRGAQAQAPVAEPHAEEKR